MNKKYLGMICWVWFGINGMHKDTEKTYAHYRQEVEKLIFGPKLVFEKDHTEGCCSKAEYFMFLLQEDVAQKLETLSYKYCMRDKSFFINEALENCSCKNNHALRIMQNECVCKNFLALIMPKSAQTLKSLSEQERSQIVNQAILEYDNEV